MNMSYCQWQNTALALEQVASDYEDRLNGEAEEPLSGDERRAMARCFELMRDMMEVANIDDDTHDAGEQAIAMVATV